MVEMPLNSAASADSRKGEVDCYPCAWTLGLEVYELRGLRPLLSPEEVLSGIAFVLQKNVSHPIGKEPQPSVSAG